MDRATRIRLRALTRAVYDSSPSAAPRPDRIHRLLPSARSVMVLLAVVAGLCLLSLWRLSGAPGEPVADAPHSAGEDAAEPTARDRGPAPPSPRGEPLAAEQSGAEGIVVHVVGAVAAPGVVRLPPGSRAQDAIASAGGALPEADTAAINLARPVVDGEQIVVPTAGEEGAAPSAPGGGVGGAPAPCVDLNTADAAALESLDGVGPALAARIVAHREAHGPFASVGDVDDVPGIGPALVERIGAGACP
ncbi:ComEA family DNA-binding protein [Actinomyces sp. B33]|uniref:ComEA family DNA-binding protein n=1 Tax=Actinomyces sp. B33 TaxID=2942131 RepID=UPI0023415FCE|nr:ComEA family DNA-binding protein [Actinomyces sp. B33]MDC4232816.1 ComEA family DNA-binding protein [Actinomyces sp. B33]